MAAGLSDMQVAQLETCANPIFIIGSPRSGTSILAWSLAQHTRLWTSGEVHILYSLFGTEGFHRRFQKENELPHGWFAEQGVKKHEFLACLGLGLNALFTSRSGGKRWVDQTPVNTLMADALADMFPGAFFVHILRDGRRVVNSMINFHNAFRPEAKATAVRAGWYPPWARDFREACKTWCVSVEAAMGFAQRNPTRCLTVRHEDLVSSPDKWFGEILRFIGVPHEAGPANHFRSNRLHSSFQQSGSERGCAQRVPDPWKEWDREQKMIFLGEAGLTLLKYDMATEDELWPPKDSDYRRLVAQVRRVVSLALPPDCSVAVISRGDDELLSLYGRRAWHLPQGEGGGYAGYHPGDSDEAIRHLEALRTSGANYLLLPGTSFWWLEHYGQFRQHLEARYTPVWSDESCIIYSLADSTSAAPTPRSEATVTVS